MRKYTENDYGFLYSILAKEGFSDNRMSFATDKTFITDYGFFSYRMEHGYPYLSHFYTTIRGISTARKLIKRFFKETRNHKYFIAEVAREKPEIKSFIKYLGQSEPYHEKDGDKFYFVKIKRCKP